MAWLMWVVLIGAAVIVVQDVQLARFSASIPRDPAELEAVARRLTQERGFGQTQAIRALQKAFPGLSVVAAQGIVDRVLLEQPRQVA
ncbi:hypothetical protein [Lacticaseibacillus parakribbianus]|uniref:hypothetical protein n=1 Tax=Lacticaseibacillus parakribbianus TaxID=2970927 RepID=UPI0021CB8186|nr:hypothetical protein [Lacticaseibacillus parakribbianus]